MGNMPYCRFFNTLSDLRDCYDHMDDDKELSSEEERAKEKLIKLCGRIFDDYGDEE